VAKISAGVHELCFRQLARGSSGDPGGEKAQKYPLASLCKNARGIYEAHPVRRWFGNAPVETADAAEKFQGCVSLFIWSKIGWFGLLRSRIRCNSFNLNRAILQQRNQGAYCREYGSQQRSNYSGRQGKFGNDPIPLPHNNPACIPLMNNLFQLVE
jgi:hypothetical protein